ncbi:zeta toxin family protein [Nocardia sp. NPDC001965]
MVALPDGFPLGVCEPVLGPFPRGNPEALRTGGDAWERAARRCLSEAEGLEDVASSLSRCSTGDTAVEAQRVLGGSAARRRDLAVYCESKAVECRETANAIELGQFTWIVMGSALVVELLASLVMPAGGMVAAAGVRAAARKGWQLAWVRLIESVVALCARLSASRAALIGQGIVVGGVVGGGVTWGGQIWQQHRRDRDTIDWETVTVSGAGGAAGGLGAGVLYMRPVAGVLARLQATGTRGAGAVATLLAGGAAGVAGGVTGTLGGAVAAGVYSGKFTIPDRSELYPGAVSGALEGLLSGGVHTVGHSAVPPRPAAGLLGSPARSPKPSDLAALFTRVVNSRASGPSGGADLPGTATATAAHSSFQLGDRSSAGPARSMKPVAEPFVGVAKTATEPDPAATTDPLPPDDRSATAASSDPAIPGVAEAGTTADTGIDSYPRPATDDAPAERPATGSRYRTGPGADDASVTTGVRVSAGPATDPPAAVTDSATRTTGNAAGIHIPVGADIAVTAADPGRLTVPTPSDPPVETAFPPFSADAHNRSEPHENIPWTRTTEHLTPPEFPTPEHNPAPRRSPHNPPREPGSSAPADERGWRQRRVQDESELARALYHRPETRRAVIAVIDRLRAVLSALHPHATREQIDNAFYTPEETISGGMVLRSVPLDELRRDGNLRELMSAVQNAMWRSREIADPSGTTLDDGLAGLLNQPEWGERAKRLGLNADALGRVRESITGGDPGAAIAARELRSSGHGMSDPGHITIREEIVRSGANRMPREIPDQVRRSLTVQDWSVLGMPLSTRELEAIPGGLVALRKTRLDPHLPLPRDKRGRVDVKSLEARLAAEDPAFRHILPLYRYDEHGRRMRDESGHAVVDGVLAYHEHGTVDATTALRLDPHEFAVPLPWRPGAARFDFAKDGEWFRRTAVERGVPVGSGVSGTAARIAARFDWIMPPGVSKHDFAGAILSLLLPQHHSLYETVWGMQMVGMSVVDAAVFRAPDSTVADLYEAVFGVFGIPAPESPARAAPLSAVSHSHSRAPYAITEPELLPSVEDFELSDRRIQSIFDEKIAPALLTDRPMRSLEQVDEPVLYVIGGQPGAGKSTLVDRIRDELSEQGGAALIQADELERFHPAYSALYRENDFTAHDYLYPTARKFRDMLEGFLVPGPHNLIMEGGNSDPRGTLARIAHIGESRSRTIMEVIALPREQSDLARLERFVNGRETVGFGRYVTRRTHDRLYLGASELVRLVESEMPVSVNSLRIRTRTDLLYENHRTSDGKWHDPPRARVILEAERNREWTSEECRAFEDRIAGLSEFVDSKVHQDPARWMPLVDEIDGLRVLAEHKLSGSASP